MKRKFALLITLVVLMASFIPISANALEDFKAYTPYDLTATFMEVDGMHPYGSALLTFKINNLPRNSNDKQFLYVHIEKKIGDGEWMGVSQDLSDTYLDEYQQSPGVFAFEQKWVEDYAWDDTIIISYRASVVLEDIVEAANEWSTPSSNIATLGLKASPWAVAELKKAEEMGLIPGILKGADMTKPITREEFAELSVLLYEKVSLKTSEAVSPNPFNDTINPQILKAFKLGITSGTSTTTFSPYVLINREQCAAMLFRAMKAIKPEADYSIVGVKDFPDQQYISAYAVEATKYMSKIGVITGDAQGNFMPKATTTAQVATGYGMATREQAIALTIRTHDKFK